MGKTFGILSSTCALTDSLPAPLSYRNIFAGYYSRPRIEPCDLLKLWQTNCAVLPLHFWLFTDVSRQYKIRLIVKVKVGDEDGAKIRIPVQPPQRPAIQ
jgi:hypothetical protein